MDSDIVILVAEDDPNDVTLLELAIRKNGITAPVNVVHDGEEAVEYLEGKGRYADRQKYPFPSVIITDVKMPRRDGLEVVEWVRQHPRCSVMPIVMLSGSRIEQDVLKAYKLGANSYFTKPGTLDQLTELIRLAFDYWTKCELPSVPKAAPP
jgi:CheY-like chemotaxis protein